MLCLHLAISWIAYLLMSELLVQNHIAGGKIAHIICMKPSTQKIRWSQNGTRIQKSMNTPIPTSRTFVSSWVTMPQEEVTSMSKTMQIDVLAHHLDPKWCLAPKCQHRLPSPPQESLCRVRWHYLERQLNLCQKSRPSHPEDTVWSTILIQNCGQHPNFNEECHPDPGNSHVKFGNDISRHVRMER